MEKSLLVVLSVWLSAVGAVLTDKVIMVPVLKPDPFTVSRPPGKTLVGERVSDGPAAAAGDILAACHGTITAARRTIMALFIMLKPHSSLVRNRRS